MLRDWYCLITTTHSSRSIQFYGHFIQKLYMQTKTKVFFFFFFEFQKKKKRKEKKVKKISWLI